jgi:hypothetical protein
MTDEKPTPSPDQRITRATALGIAARIHQGTGIDPHSVIADAVVYGDWLRTGVVPEPVIRCRRSVNSDSLTEWEGIPLEPYRPPHVEVRPRRRRWWRKPPSMTPDAQFERLSDNLRREILRNAGYGPEGDETR